MKMKKILNCILICAVVMGISSCKKFLDVNDNPNNATESNADLVLPQAIVATAAHTSGFNQSMNVPGGFFAGVAGVGGYGATYTWAYTTNSFTAMWTNTYDNANDYQYVITTNAGDPQLVFTTSIARIMKAFAFARLVDQYNDVPYSDALKGVGSLAPKYDKAEDIYKDLIKELTESIAAISTGQAAPVSAGVKAVATPIDPLFKGSGAFATGFSGMDKWKRFANTVRLRLLVKMAGVPALNSYATPLFATTASVGYIQEDALCNPGYTKEAGRQSPQWNNYGASVSDLATITQNVPTKWILSFYNGVKLNDQVRGRVSFRSFPNTNVNQLGDETSASVAAVAPPYNAWYSAATWADAAAGNAYGIAKGPSQGQPIFMFSELNFLIAECQVRGYLPVGDGGASAFKAGITASFDYLYRNQNGILNPTKVAPSASCPTCSTIATDVDAYITSNAGAAKPYLVNYALALTTNEKIEAISTQKYIALANIMNDEAFNEYKRTGYPAVITNGPAPATDTFASKQSVATSPDKIITRFLYPQEEYNLNAGNAKPGISLYTSKIFWDVN
ncbi:SusD/RagB family nutrient-binding outer membrane lipoprotein [Pedobacter polaris]|uniref:SusD/RagB family nutrient-binding outer membrane lipoprotein n=2 Tax=Pedobacter polaris TaxID=2571273 RepID=A0A4U1CH88_9SPHI|nr:SusD/RagB family nutrient-binding outer membrane lipoprotein [Pedobacter polaris]